jgi:hypothetical protein
MTAPSDPDLIAVAATDLLLYRALFEDGRAYAALEDYYLERSDEWAATGVRRATPGRRRPYHGRYTLAGKFCWCLNGHPDDRLSRSILSRRPTIDGESKWVELDSPADAWRWFGAWEGETQ